jgi:hypothetical protein
VPDTYWLAFTPVAIAGHLGSAGGSEFIVKIGIVVQLFCPHWQKSRNSHSKYRVAFLTHCLP